MNKINKDSLYVIGGIAFVIILGLFLIFSWKSNPIDGSSIDSLGSFQPKSSGSTNNNDVEIILTPKQANGILEVIINANTHSVDLSQFDLNEITLLEYDGNEIKPSSAPKLSGHHVSGSLIFNIDKQINNFVIKIKGIPLDSERVFSWV